MTHIDIVDRAIRDASNNEHNLDDAITIWSETMSTHEIATLILRE